MSPLSMETLSNAWYGSWRPLTNLTQTFQACHLCTFNVAAIFFWGHPYTYYRTPWLLFSHRLDCDLPLWLHYGFTGGCLNWQWFTFSKNSSIKIWPFTTSYNQSWLVASEGEYVTRLLMHLSLLPSLVAWQPKLQVSNAWFTLPSTTV